MSYVLMDLSHFYTHALIRSGIPHIKLFSVSSEMLRQAGQTFSMRVASDVAGFILSTLS